MKKTLFIFILTFISLFIISNSSYALVKTKHITAGSTNLVIEAPQGMCFLDSSNTNSQTVYKQALAELSDKQKYVLAIFTPCSILANAIGELSSTRIMESFGYISWLYPSYEYPYNKGRNQFILDNIEKYKKNGLWKGLTKLDNGIATLVRSSKKVDEKIIDNITLISYTTIRDVPLEIKLKDKLENFGTAEESYTILNKFNNYQINLNEK